MFAHLRGDHLSQFYKGSQKRHFPWQSQAQIPNQQSKATDETNVGLVDVLVVTNSVIVTPCSVSSAIRQSPYTKGYLTQHRKPPRFFFNCIFCLGEQYCTLVMKTALNWSCSSFQMGHLDRKIDCMSQMFRTMLLQQQQQQERFFNQQHEQFIKYIEKQKSSSNSNSQDNGHDQFNVNYDVWESLNNPIKVEILFQTVFTSLKIYDIVGFWAFGLFSFLASGTVSLPPLCKMPEKLPSCKIIGNERSIMASLKISQNCDYPPNTNTPLDI